jgi:NAD(P) transhydrogenase subunit alpha
VSGPNTTHAIIGNECEMIGVQPRQGRRLVARGASPWFHVNSKASPGRGDGVDMTSQVRRPFRGSVVLGDVHQGLTPLATNQRPYRGYRPLIAMIVIAITLMATTASFANDTTPTPTPAAHSNIDYVSMLFVFMLATFIGIGVIRRVSRLLHTPLMSLTNAISAIAVVGAIIVAGGKEYSTPVRLLGAIALFASMTNIISGFMITERMLKMFKSDKEAR